MSDPRYTTCIPHRAAEHVIRTYPNGCKEHAEYVIDGDVVGWRHWDEQGHLSREMPLKKGVAHGTEYSWYFDGILTSAEPYFEGKAHGIARQWSHDGKLLGSYTMLHGTGIDLWWQEREDGTSYVSEVYYLQDGQRHGFEWWLKHNQRSVSVERHWSQNLLHGIEREWGARGGLCRGYPRYWIHGKRVSKRDYECAAATDLPKYLAGENSPIRIFPSEIRERLTLPRV